MNKKLAELTDEELAQVSGGVLPGDGGPGIELPGDGFGNHEFEFNSN